MTTYDIVIVGGGPAGLTASIYGARAGKSVLVIEKEVMGGNITQTPFVENIPGFVGSGSDFGNKLYEQAESQGVQFAFDNITAIRWISKDRVILAGEFDAYEGKTCIIATGTKHRTLGLAHEDELIGKGIHFCATCDGPFYKGKRVAVVGGGNSAVTEAIELASMVEHVYIYQDLPTLTAEQSLLDKLNSLKNVSVLCNSKVIEYKTDDEGNFTGIMANYEDDTKVATVTQPVDGVFLAIGFIPQNDNFKDMVDVNERGYITLELHDNIFSCGDCTSEPIKQVAVACGSGAKASLGAIKYINKLDKE